MKRGYLSMKRIAIASQIVTRTKELNVMEKRELSINPEHLTAYNQTQLSHVQSVDVCHSTLYEFWDVPKS